MADRNDDYIDRHSTQYETDYDQLATGSDFAGDSIEFPSIPLTQTKSDRTHLKKGRIPAINGRGSRAKLFDKEPEIIGSSPAAHALRDKVSLYADLEAPVTIIGESGVGKELVARKLHDSSHRRKKAFVPVNVGAISKDLAASEIFGHVKGAYTGAVSDREGVVAAAKGGTLFLDEIGDMPIGLQPQLLRVLEDGLVTKVGSNSATKVEFRLVTATNVDLKQHVQTNKFRLDLFYRINVLVIDIPPLRARDDDVIEIAEMMIASHCNARNAIKLTPHAADKLKAHHFPGNVRELRNVLTRAIAHARGNKILPENITFDTAAPIGCAEEGDLDITKAKDAVNRYLLLKALKLCDGNVTKAATLTGRSRGTIHALKKQISPNGLDTEFENASHIIRRLFQQDRIAG